MGSNVVRAVITFMYTSRNGLLTFVIEPSFEPRGSKWLHHKFVTESMYTVHKLFVRNMAVSLDLTPLLLLARHNHNKDLV